MGLRLCRVVGESAFSGTEGLGFGGLDVLLDSEGDVSSFYPRILGKILAVECYPAGFVVWLDSYL